MRIPTWRLALTGAAIVILAAAGVGLVAASSAAPAAPASEVANAPDASPATRGDANRHPGLRRLLGRVGPAAKHFVNGTLTYVDKDGNLVTVQLDHGTITSIGSGSITIGEQGGHQVTISTDETTVVRLGGGAGIGKLSDLKAGDEVFVQSRVGGGSTLAKHVLRVPPATPTTGG